MFITMTTPALTPFHQKIFPHAKSTKRDLFSAFSFLKFRIPHFTFPNQIPPFRPLRPLREQSAFTLIELLAVITIIGILAGLTLGAAGAVRRHGANSTAKAEVAALQAACDRYFADYNLYPSITSTTPSVVKSNELRQCGPDSLHQSLRHEPVQPRPIHQTLLRTQTRYGQQHD